ncbi:MAG TPA: DNA-processing protein DprA [Longimicrobiales bacterium]|nr:DNA-processing protein DprA [Longimicrobiales bacterium]
MVALSARGDTRAEARALLVLDQLPGVGLATLKALVLACGSGEAALRAPRSKFRELAGGEAERGRWDPAWARLVDAGLAEADRLGMEIRTWVSPDYPPTLLHLHDPPPVLFLRGHAELLGRPSITVVGARRATARGREVAERLGRDLARAGACVVSGMALGVDAAAHRGALAGEGATVAVLGRGADAPYPPGHRRLFQQILERGLVVSEFLPGTPALPHHFPRRNRILAGLAQTLVVVEAAAKSGALITVDHALDVGIDVWAVPGPIDVAACAGSNRMLADGARPLVSIADFVREVTGSETGGEASTGVARGPAGQLLSGMGDETLDVDELARRSGLTVAAALALLTEMELTGLVRQLPGMRFRRAA